jgi:hypothetical protein
MSGDIDAGLRRVFAGIDTTPGFEGRVLARIAALPAMEQAAERERLERQRVNVAHRIAREAWMNAATAIGVGVAAIAVIWRHADAAARWTAEALAVSSSPEVLMPAAMTVLAAGLWPVLRKLLPR